MLLGHQCMIGNSDRIFLLLGKAKKDVTVHGEDAVKSNPKHMLSEKAKNPLYSSCFEGSS